jgi:tight adherence protein C
VIIDRVVVGAGLLVWFGATLILSSWARLSRPSLQERLRPFNPGAASLPSLQDRTAVDVLVPLAESIGARLAGLFGVAEPLEPRLRRVHSPLSPSAFRLRQLALTLAAFLSGALVATVSGAPIPVSLLLVAGGPLLTFLVVEQRLAGQSERWQRAVAAELPVVAEQLAMLLNAGYSLGAALSRLAERGRGCVARDLEQVVNRVLQGLSEGAALREWAELAKVEQVDRLVSVLILHSEAQDLGRLVSAEARYARRDLHRRSLELMDRRSQQVWVPVTVATLVPGVILLAVPFLAALRLFANA